MTFVPGQTLTAAEVNQLVPPNAGLLGGTGTTFTVVNLGTGLTITSSTLEPNWQADLITALGSGIGVSGGTLSATGSGGSVTDIETGALLTGGPITTTGTIAVAPVAGSTLLGNASGLTATPAAIPVGSGLAFSGGSLTATGAAGAAGGVLSGTYPNPGFASIAAASFLANSGSVSAAPAATPLGAGLAFSTGSLVANYQAAAVTTLGSGISNVGGTLSATGTGGSVTSVVAGTGLNGGTISTTGTLTANYQAGTLASFATGLSLVGTALTPAVAAAGNGIAINSGTVSVDNSQTLTGTVASTLTIAPASGTNNVVVNMPTAAGTVTLAAAPAYTFQKVLLNIKQGSTPQAVSLNSGFVFGTSGGPTSYTATATANARDILGLYSPDGTHWVVDGILQGLTI